MRIEQRMSRWEERRGFETLWWAGTLIWTGLVFGAASLDWLPQIGHADAWTWVFLGAGLYGLVGTLYRQVSAGGADLGRGGLPGPHRTAQVMERRAAHRRAQVTARAWPAQRHGQRPGECRWQQAGRPEEGADRGIGSRMEEGVS
jgi:hypothetical protein